ncbi:MAG: hypothetical protein KKD01_19600 [Proteobacteria bacterium]|nr:hypothetical protein [Pseudomonadota bacterium]
MKASDLKGQDLTLEIDHIEHMPVGREQELAGVLFWTDALFKPLIMNMTNGRKISELCGPALDDWVGQKITLYAVEVNTPDGPKMGIRVR